MIERESTLSALVFVIDDDPSIRASLTSLLRSVGHEVLSFETTEQFLGAERPDAPACLVLDVRLPGTSGLKFQRALAASDMSVPIVFITGHGDIEMSVAAMKGGALEFLIKPFRDQDLLDAVHKGLETDRLRREKAATLTGLWERYASLTPREQEVMAFVADGQMNKQIAHALALSEVTVKAHRAQIMRKMQAKSLPDLVRIADRLNASIQKA
ncbi:response regulator [Aurantimonas sp. 22II-16-19i]|uniref:response regulator transcription factor n=1 Tax=Aurantimonas sp. 22II-16-19i TaxID=1317114 RepID=UPI0009F7E77A|nr:response regulator [Aurantimonas sp. 22II-16-19i]ORE93315.1 two component transcriptional regulatory protein, LuxR family [Aurantimonas sp. 22II-16-19i]